MPERVITLFDDRRYAALALAGQRAFREATPFRHTVIDDFLPQDIARALADAFPDPAPDEPRWRRHVNANVSRVFIEDVAALPLPLRLLAAALTARPFLLFAETLSGVESLIADPYFLGGGAMASGRGDFLNVHADFNWHHKLQARRRLNALLYLTPDWRPEWGGDLELWGRSSAKVVEPRFNRLVMFEVDDDALHGQPEPLRCPSGAYRKVFSTFFYTARRDEDEWEAPHFTQYRPEQSPYSMQLLEGYRRSAGDAAPADVNGRGQP